MPKAAIKSFLFVPIPALLCSLPLWAAATTAGDDEQRWFWTLLIALFVLATTMASAVLPVAALRTWRGAWRLGALLPLLLLVAWLLLIGLSKWLSPDSHSLWLFEVFAWAMLNMIYMVALMTAKRILEKEDQKDSLSD